LVSSEKQLSSNDLQFPTKATANEAGKLADEVKRLQNELDLVRSATIAANPIWEGRGFATDENYCFVLMPFAEDCDVQDVYMNHVKPVVEKRCGLVCQRADDIHDISGIMQSVWERINKARIIIAEMTDRNSNVFYELGIAHTLGKPVIMITQSMDYVPFDLKHLRCLVYAFKPSRIQQFENALERTIQTVLSSTPVSRAVIELRKAPA
jgi:nucleoside 2-deoxyribosyltransferase